MHMARFRPSLIKIVLPNPPNESMPMLWIVDSLIVVDRDISYRAFSLILPSLEPRPRVSSYKSNYALPES